MGELRDQLKKVRGSPCTDPQQARYEGELDCICILEAQKRSSLSSL